MKRYLSFFITAVLLLCCLPGCSPADRPAAADDGKLQIVTTIFPEYDWVMQVLGENPADAEVTMLLDRGVDLHSFQPSADDILKISTCDVFIYVGGESDDWVDDALEEATNKDMVVINLLDVLGNSAKEEEVREGMSENSHDHESDDHDNDDIEYDEHVWLSLRNASVFVRKIADVLKAADPDRADTYESNTSAYIDQLGALDAEYQTAVDRAGFHTLLFGDRFPFRYLVDDYGLDYYAAFSGCSAETEASFETITFLAEKLDELDLPAVMTIEGSDHRVAETIIQTTRSKNQKILTMDSIQSVTKEDVQEGTTYLAIMESNLAILNEALNNAKGDG